MSSGLGLQSEVNNYIKDHKPSAVQRLIKSYLNQFKVMTSFLSRKEQNPVFDLSLESKFRLWQRGFVRCEVRMLKFQHLHVCEVKVASRNISKIVIKLFK